MKQRAISVNLWRGLDHHGFRVQTVSTKHCSRPKGRNDGRIASLSHRTRGGYKNLPPPLITKRIDGYIEERVFENFQNFWEPRFKMLEPGFWVFSRRVKEQIPGLITWGYTRLVLIPAQRRSGPLRVRGGWSGVAAGVRRSRVPLIYHYFAKGLKCWAIYICCKRIQMIVLQMAIGFTMHICKGHLL